MKPFTRRLPYQTPKPTPAQVLAAMRATAPTVEAQARVEALGERWAAKASAPLKEEGVFVCDMPVPPRELHPNARVHFMAKAKATAQYQRWVQAAVNMAYPQRSWPVFRGKVRLSLTFVYPDERRRDLDNAAASAKSLIDTLVSMGVLKDDGHKVIESITVQRRTERGQSARVTVRIVAVGA